MQRTMASSPPEQTRRNSEEIFQDPSAVEGVHFDGLFRKEWDTWAKTGRLDHKGLRAALPDVVAGLLNGNIDPEDFARCLTWQEMVAARQDIQHIPCGRVVGSNGPFQTIFGQALFICVMEFLRVEPSATETQEFARFVDNLHEEMALVMSHGVDPDTYPRYAPGCRSLTVTDSDDFRETLFYAVWLYAFHRAWEKNKTYLEKLIGEGLEQSPILRTDGPKREVDRMMDQAFHESVDRSSSEFKAFYRRIKPVYLKRERILEAAQSIAKGSAFLEEMCWECNTAKAEVFQCGGCKMAYYCCKEHQRQAWSGGHRNSCEFVTEVRKFMETNLKRIEKAVKGDDILNEGQRLLRPCLEIDCLILKGFFEVYVSTGLQEPTPQVSRLGPPTMENYYRNLADVVNGEECFVFPDTPNHAFKDSKNDGGISLYEDVMDGKDNPIRGILRVLASAIGFRPESSDDREELVEEMEYDSNPEHDYDEHPDPLVEDLRDAILEENAMLMYPSGANPEAESIWRCTARQFLNRYRSYHVESKKSYWKEIKTNLLCFMRDYLHGKMHRLPEKPRGFSSLK